MENNRIRVLGVLNLLPTYRKAIINNLLNDTDIDYTFFFGKNSNIPSLSTLNISSFAGRSVYTKLFTVNNHWLGQAFLWQEKVCRPSFYSGYDVVIHTGSMYQISTWVALLIGRALGKRQLLWTHGLSNKEDNIKGVVRRLFYRLSDGLLLYGHKAKDLLIDYGFDPDSLYVIYNSLDYNAQRKHREAVTAHEINLLKERYYSRPQLPLLVYIGRLTAEKNPLLLADLLLEMQKRGQPVNLLVIGDGPERSLLENKISDHNLNNCLYVYGPCHDEAQLAPMLCAADLAIMPGYVGLSAMHYLAYGLPVLTSNDIENQKPEIEAIVEGVTGDYYEHCNVISFGDKVSEWLLKVSQELRAACIKQIEELYNPEIQHLIINHACMGHPATTQPYKENPGYKDRRNK